MEAHKKAPKKYHKPEENIYDINYDRNGEKIKPEEEKKPEEVKK